MYTNHDFPDLITTLYKCVNVRDPVKPPSKKDIIIIIVCVGEPTFLTLQ